MGCLVPVGAGNGTDVRAECGSFLSGPQPTSPATQTAVTAALTTRIVIALIAVTVLPAPGWPASTPDIRLPEWIRQVHRQRAGSRRRPGRSCPPVQLVRSRRRRP